MRTLEDLMREYQKLLDSGLIQQAYKGLMAYIMELRTLFSKTYPGLNPGSLYHGYMDMSYFPLFPEYLKSRKLKIAVVYLHEKGRFEVWLSGMNKQVQARYCRLFKDANGATYRISTPEIGSDSIVEHTLTGHAGFKDLDTLTELITEGTIIFIQNIERILKENIIN